VIEKSIKKSFKYKTNDKNKWYSIYPYIL
jgi:hypothetical protein